jgi:hypothetical protein
MDQPWLPPELAARPFAVTDARTTGMPRWRLRAPSLTIPTRSVRTVGPLETSVDRARAFRVALPEDVVFSHVTACQVWDLPLPRWLEGQPMLDVMRATAHNRIRRSGCSGHRGLEHRRTARCRGLPVTGLADTWVDLGEVLGRGLEMDDLVVIGDQVVTRLAGEPEPGELPRERYARARALLGEALTARVRPRGKAMLTAALELVRAPVRSPMETRARLMFHRAGFPEPQVNFDAQGVGGGWLLEGDLVWPEQRVVGEYQGKDHASIRRRSYDADRQAVAGDEGWRVLEIFAEDVFHRPRRQACLRRFARELALDPALLSIS